MHVQFYTKKGCHLCDEAASMMKLVQEDYPLTWSTIDIETDDESHEKYMLMIPVIEKEGEVLLYGSIGYIDLIDLFKNE
ncbi:glutaredoxin family protein [Sporosarcina luteola]|uniref:glutaredoxin family protein n=1 Tax=Sporosarcina luteola TaxID=582850 RepID=UPI00203F45A9|nr:glutaredoxin family protein [Sporosarcina luteola]MCM3745346.1 glutaredoxin family protein [Sporosarcina luteola]